MSERGVRFIRILDVNTDKAIRNIVLYLKIEEAREVYDSLGMLLKENDFGAHAHINDESYEHELTVVLYDEQNMSSLSKRSIEIIKEN